MCCISSLQDLSQQYVRVPVVCTYLLHFFSYFVHKKQNKNKPILLLQLLCFYYVLTTFTTVGYGESVSQFCPNLVSDSYSAPHIPSAGDIFATSEGERVTFALGIMLLKIHHDGGCVLGLLYLPLLVCCIAFWNYHCSSQ